MIPITRKDHYLNEIVGWGDNAPEKPYIEEEFFFAEILGEAVQAPEPLPRYQLYLAKIAGKDVEIPYPETRLEYFLAKAAGMEIETPTPITREEIFWSNYHAIVDFEVEGIPPLTYKAIEGTLENYRIYGNTVNGENVGDLITEGEHAGEYEVPVTVEGKNLLPNTATSQTVNGVTFTVNNDGSVTCNGTARGFAVVYLGERRSTVVHPTGNEYSLSKGTYKLTGCPINGTGNTFYQEVYSSSINLTRDYGDGTEFNVTTNDIISVRLVIFSGYTCNNLIFYPMIRKADIEDDTYEPYHAPVTTNIYLPKQIKMVGNEAEYIDYGEQKQHRVRKNLLQNTGTSRTINGVTFTVNSDGSVTCNTDENGATATAIFNVRAQNFTLASDNYILSGCPIGGDISTKYKLDAQVFTDGFESWIADIGDGVNIYSDKIITILLMRIIIYKNQVCDNLTFYPMIRKADIEDDTYEPYIEDTELNVTLPALPTLSGTNTLSVGTRVQPSKVYVKGEKEREYT